MGNFRRRRQPVEVVPHQEVAAFHHGVEGKDDQDIGAEPDNFAERRREFRHQNIQSQMLIMNVCPEEARLVLPMNTMTTFVLTGSVMAMLRIVNQRMDSHAQLMAQEFAKQVYNVAMQHFPVSTEALKK